jgi:hypothetical protein
VVVDHFDTDSPRELQVLWHYAPTCNVVLENDEAVSVNPEEGNLRLVPIGALNWSVGLVSGQEQPTIQGWYSEEYGTKVPNSTVVYTTTIDKPTTFAWLLAPFKGPVPKFHTNLVQKDRDLEVKISRLGQSSNTLSIPAKGVPTVK